MTTSDDRGGNVTKGPWGARPIVRPSQLSMDEASRFAGMIERMAERGFIDPADVSVAAEWARSDAEISRLAPIARAEPAAIDGEDDEGPGLVANPTHTALSAAMVRSSELLRQLGMTPASGSGPADTT